MQFSAVGYTDIGTTKKSNQDSYCIKIADTEIGQVALLAVADGMGGLQKGELASGCVIQTLSHWFENDFKMSLEVMNSSVSGLESFLTGQWSGIVQELNMKIMRYGRSEGLNLGTTLSALLVVGARYSIIHVGDSRVYEISTSGNIKQLTTDQTYIHREIEAGRMSVEEAKNHPKRNVLLQCIGSSKMVEPQVVHGNLLKDAIYVICSDGFRHNLEDNHFKELFKSSKGKNFENNVIKKLKELVEYDKETGESDNITATVLKVRK